jgi:hypothetical protein
MPLTISVIETDTAGKPVGGELHVTVDINGPAHTISEVAVRSANGGVTDLPDIDLVGLVKALRTDGAKLGTVTDYAKMIDSVPAAVTTKPARKRATKATTPKAATTDPQTTEEPGGTTKRTYRRMPEDFAATVAQVGDATPVLMEHYDAPRHTVAGWLRKLRATATT